MVRKKKRHAPEEEAKQNGDAESNGKRKAEEVVDEVVMSESKKAKVEDAPASP